MTENTTSSPNKSPEDLLDLWAHLKHLVEEVDPEVNKNLVKGNAAAGRRVRSEFRFIKKTLTELTRELVVLDKSRKEAAKANKSAADKE